VWFGRRAFAAGGFRHIGKEFVVIDLDTVTKTFGGDGIDGNSHGKPRGQQEKSFDQKRP
jgi:hypothetical protein